MSYSNIIIVAAGMVLNVERVKSEGDTPAWLYGDPPLTPAGVWVAARKVGRCERPRVGGEVPATCCKSNRIGICDVISETVLYN